MIAEIARTRTWCAMCGIAPFIALGVAGCGRPIPAGMVRVRGEVRCDGVPLPTGTIMFEGSGGTGSGAGRILPAGTFEVTLRPGNYRVAIRSLQGAAYYNQDRKLVKPKSHIPLRYELVATSGLEVTVTPHADSLSISLEHGPETE